MQSGGNLPQETVPLRAAPGPPRAPTLTYHPVDVQPLPRPPKRTALLFPTGSMLHLRESTMHGRRWQALPGRSRSTHLEKRESSLIQQRESDWLMPRGGGLKQKVLLTSIHRRLMTSTYSGILKSLRSRSTLHCEQFKQRQETASLATQADGKCKADRQN